MICTQLRAPSCRVGTPEAGNRWRRDGGAAFSRHRALGEHASKLRCRISVSLDGFVAGPNQSPKEPLGVSGERLHEWVTVLEAWRRAHGKTDGEVNENTAVMEQELADIGATIMGRNMFGGHPGPWSETDPWKGWRGRNPPFHHPVFGGGERLFDTVDDLHGLVLVETVAVPNVTHLKFART